MSIPAEINHVFDPNLSKEERKERRQSWSNEKVDPNEALKYLVLKMRLHSLPDSGSTTSLSESEPESDPATGPDCTTLLTDELLMKVFCRIGDTKQLLSNSLVCRRWCAVNGKLIQSLNLFDWEFLESGRLTFRFPNLIHVNIVNACIKPMGNPGILLSNRLFSVNLSSAGLENDGFFIRNEDVLAPLDVDHGLEILAAGCENLRRVELMNVSERGLGLLGEGCECLQEMELHYCNDLALKGISKCRNLQVLRLIGSVNGVYNSAITDVGMTILAQGCRRLVKLELVGCEGSYDGIKAIGQCCQMLEDLTLCNHRMEGGWLSALSYCGNLKTLRIQSCNDVDNSPGSDEHLWPCPMLQELHLSQSHLRDKHGVRALFIVCQTVRSLVLKDCWGLDNNIFAAASIFGEIKSLSLEGCSLLTTEGLESIVLNWKELDSVRVVSCNSIKDNEITPELATLFSNLKEFKWRPDSRSLLSANLGKTSIGHKGGRYLGRN